MLRWMGDPETGALYVRPSDELIIESEQVKPGVILDYDEAGNVVGIEILNASERDEAPLKQAA
jgi:uncharacterized protein YuzE